MDLVFKAESKVGGSVDHIVAPGKKDPVSLYVIEQEAKPKAKKST